MSTDTYFASVGSSNVYFVRVGYKPGTFPKNKPQAQTLHFACNTYQELLDKVYSDPNVTDCKVASIRLPSGQWVANPETPGNYDQSAKG